MRSCKRLRGVAVGVGTPLIDLFEPVHYHSWPMSMRLRECCSILAFGVLACAVISWPVCRVVHDVMGVCVRSMHVRGGIGPERCAAAPRLVSISR